jgi:hypothetical protein
LPGAINGRHQQSRIGTWYFGDMAYTTAGTQSAMSAVVSKTIP